mgnify:CR=1 FL=1
MVVLGLLEDNKHIKDMLEDPDKWWNKLPDDTKFDYIITILNNPGLSSSHQATIDDNKEFLEKISKKYGFNSIDNLINHYKAIDLLIGKDPFHKLLEMKFKYQSDMIYDNKKNRGDFLITTPNIKEILKDII